MSIGRPGFGVGVRKDELVKWVRSQVNLAVVYRGEQTQLFESEAIRMYEMYGDNGESRMVSEITMWELTLPLWRQG